MYRKAQLHGAEYSDRAMAGAKPMILNDGATIAQGIVMEDPVEELGAQLLRQVSTVTNDRAGDGTTTSVVLAREILHLSLTNLEAGTYPLLLNKGIAGGVKVALDSLEKQSAPADTPQALARVAAISCQDEALGNLVAQALSAVGPEGVVEDSGLRETTLEVEEGIVFERGFLSPLMATDGDQTHAVLENAASVAEILLTSQACLVEALQKEEAL